MPMLPILEGIPPACLPHLFAASQAAGRFEASRDAADLEQAAGAWRLAFATEGFGDAPDATQAFYYHQAIDVVEAVHHFRQDPAWLRELTDLEGTAARREPAGSDAQLSWLNRRARHLLELFEDTGDVACIDQAIGTYREAVAITQPGSLTWRILSSNLASALCDRYEATDDTSGLTEALQLARASVDGGLIDPRYAPPVWHNLSRVLLAQARVSGDPRDRDACAESVQALTRAAERAGSAEFLDRARTTMRLLAAAGASAPSALARWHIHGEEQLKQYDGSGDARTLDRAIASLRLATTFSLAGTEAGEAARHDLSVALGRRFERSGRVQDLDEAIAVSESLTDADASDASIALHRNGLATFLYHRYDRTGAVADLDRCIELLREAERLMPADHGEVPAVVGNLGNALRVRYLASGRLDDLAEAVDQCRRAVGMLQPGDPMRASRASNLVLALIARYRRSDRGDDLEAAIAAGREAYAAIPHDHPYHHYAANNLGLALRNRAGRDRADADRDEAIALFEEADRHAQPELASRAYYLDNLAACLADRALERRALADATRAVDASRQALRLAGEGENGALFQANLAWHLLVLCSLTDDPAALDQAVDAGERAVALSAPGHPYLAERQTRLAQALSARFARLRQPRDLERTLAARQAAIDALERNLRTAPLTLGLGEQAAWSSLYERAVEELAAVGRVRDALLTAERGKSWFLVSLLERSDVPAPAGVPADLVTRERALRAQLTDLDVEALAGYGAGADDARPMHAGVGQRSQVQAALARASAELAGHGHDAATYAALHHGTALAPDDLGRLVAQLPPGGVLLSITIAGDATLLFALRRGRTREPSGRAVTGLGRDAWIEVTRRCAREVAQSRGSARVKETWHKPLAPLMAAAGELIEGARLVVLSPDPLLNDLPWSLLAQRHGWKAAVCTVPGLAVLDRIIRRRAPAQGTVLVAGNPTGDLPYARLEAEMVGAYLGATPLYGEQATKAAVLEGFAGARLAHLAAHAYFAPDDPFGSGIRLADGVLSARELLQGGHRVPPVVVLSACETGVSATLGERSGRGELAGLTQALLYAGARSLVVSLWEVADASSAAMMVQFHRAAARAAPGTRRAVALHRAMQAVRETKPGWEHPYHWGAFAVIGDWRD